MSGVSDGAIGLVSDYPQLGYDVATKEEVRTGIWKRLKYYTEFRYSLAENAVKDK